MASSRLLFTCTTVLLFLPLLFLSPSNAFSSYPNDDGRLKVSAVGSQKVNLSLYYDALCPSCATFIVKNLAGVFDKDLITIINLRLVPWGNSFVNKSNNAIVCQVRFSSPFVFFSFNFFV
jgi:interferon gamma-inducible protein 30